MIASGGEKSGNADALSIGAWVLWPNLNQIERDGDVVRLEPKAAAMLGLLARRAGEPVSRQELLDTVWAGVVVSDDALTQVVIKLRKALGDSPRDPKYIETIPKRGYRLVAPVGLVGRDTPPARRLPRFVFIAIAGLFLAGTLFFLFERLSEGFPPDEALSADSAVVEGVSVAILPFEALSQDPRGRNFARGITADLSTDLSKLPGLWVINGSEAGVEAAGARYLISGSVQHVSDRINVHVHLLESATRHQLWSERYQRPLDDLFDVQREISEKIVGQLEIEVTVADRQRLAKRYTLSIPAYEDFLQGQSELLLRNRTANENARRWYHRAIEKDPGFARAYAGLALSYAADFRNQWADDGSSALQQAADTAGTAQLIDPSIPEVYWVLSYVDVQERELESALSHLTKALDLDQSYADAYALMGGIDTYRGRPERSIPRLRQAMRLKPDAGYLYYLLLGRAYFFLGNNEQALINLRESLSRNPDSLEARIYLASTAVADDDFETAQWERNEIHAIAPDFSLRAWLETYPMTSQAQRTYLTETIAQIGL